MKGLIIYDSLFGNTEKVARAMGDGLADALGDADAVQVVAVKQAQPDQLAGWTLLVVGAPTHGSRPAPPMQEFLDRIPPGGLTGVKVAAFDTRTDMETLTGVARFFGKLFDRLGYAAPRIATALEKRGGQLVAPPAGFMVQGKEGPLEDGEEARAAAWARALAT